MRLHITAGIRGVRMALPAVMPKRHADAGADRRKALHRHGKCDDQDENKAHETVWHVLKLYYRPDGNR